LYTIANSFQFIAYNLKSSVTELILSGMEKFTYNIINDKWLNYLQYNLLSDAQNNSSVYMKHSVWYGNEFYITYKNSIRINAGYEIFDSNSSSYKSYKAVK